jgi:hypothetical protein
MYGVEANSTEWQGQLAINEEKKVLADSVGGFPVSGVDIFLRLWLFLAMCMHTMSLTSGRGVTTAALDSATAQIVSG